MNTNLIFTIVDQGAVRQSRGAEGNCCWACGQEGGGYFEC